MADDKRRFKAVIGGKTYTIVGSRSEAHMQAVTEQMNRELSQLNELAPRMSKEDAAILLAFNAISDQLIATQKLNELKSNNENQ
ncbi:stimulator of FtsZ polymerization and component of cell-division Z-ring [Secundilactobacillus oryzae JCM 18671]|uniref:Stimulator of FtsZ polymerization and component of cell-division Z-ring n=1 Tax=Secundilactobacillus oryzae JCM 18671 TaxID=1291743 RepID=A0A081BJ13_9LACO|nr:cell division protein ZapA [Secundilactobacillus oryzae]GAK48031.1 stimulator of FtsZ polymerization and component of cell-division Z-ring [Secundilactobacillus oryzae JCM 18671]